ncbi:Glycosyltransferase afumC [Cladobotryum mycophilum]|uniref:Glycosyltransferase afumC n=1 Tax=Cladobotryum mycophilum TaxID=491253 RepID=A0ABR0S9N8_9HYPO
MSPSRLEVTQDQEQDVQVPAGLVLVPEEKLDLRSDEEIIEQFQKKRPVTSEKNVWAFWHSGFNSMHPWLRRNVIGWVRRLGPEWNVHVLDDVRGSETNIRNYLAPEMLPEAINNYTADGKYKGVHTSDVVRLALVLTYGGVWLDVGTILLRHVDDICWKEIEDPSSPVEVGGYAFFGSAMNGFFAAKKDNPLLRQWHNAYLSLWEGGKTNCNGFHRHPIFDNIPKYVSKDPVFNSVDFKDFSAHITCGWVTRQIVDAETGFNGQDYWSNHVFLLDLLDEAMLLPHLTNNKGKYQFELLSAKRTGEGAVKDELWHAAEDIVHKLLTSSAMMKISHGSEGMFEALANFWDKEEHADADHEPGTFAAYLRYGSVHYDQTRKLVPLSREAMARGVDWEKWTSYEFRK